MLLMLRKDLYEFHNRHVWQPIISYRLFAIPPKSAVSHRYKKKAFITNTYRLASEYMLVHLNRLVMNHVQVRIETLGQPLGKLFLDGYWLIRIAINRSFELLK